MCQNWDHKNCIYFSKPKTESCEPTCEGGGGCCKSKPSCGGCEWGRLLVRGTVRGIGNGGLLGGEPWAEIQEKKT